MCSSATAVGLCFGHDMKSRWTAKEFQLQLVKWKKFVIFAVDENHPVKWLWAE